MPKTEVIFYRDERGQAPVVEWICELRRKDKKAYAKCNARIQVLAQLGQELRRPMADGRWPITFGTGFMSYASGKVM